MDNSKSITNVNEAKLPLWKLKQNRDSNSIVRAIGRLVTKAFVDGGRAANAEDTGYISLRIWQEIEGTRGDNGRYYRSLSGEDLAECFNNGALGRYGENYGFSVATFIQWMDRYHDEWVDKKRKEMRAAEEIAMEKRLEERPRMTPEQARLDCIRRVNEQYELFLREGGHATAREPKTIGSALALQDWGGVLRRTIEKEKGIQIKDIKSFFSECRKQGMEKIF